MALSKPGKVRWGGPPCPPEPQAARDGRPTVMWPRKNFVKQKQKTTSNGLENKPGALDGLPAADRTAGGYGQALPLAEGEAAGAADCGDQVKTPAGPGISGHMLEMSMDLFFRQREALGQFQGGMGLLPEQLTDGLAECKHEKTVFGFRFSVKKISTFDGVLPKVFYWVILS